MRRFIKLLSPLLLAALFISCAQSVKQNSSISFDGGKIVSRAVQYSINKSRSPETKAGDEYFTPEMVEAMKEALEFKATLAMEISSEDSSYNDSVEEDYTVDYPSALAQEKKNITFNNVPVGIKACIDAKITEKLLIKNNDALTEFLGYMKIPFEEFADSSEEELTEFIASILSWDSVFYGKSELTIHEGENPVTLKMTADPNGGGSGEGGEEDIPVDGTIDIEKPVKLTITIDQEKSDSKYYLNKGKIFFTLLDENGNDILEDVDWDAYSDIYGFINQNLLAVDCELYYGHNKINGLLNYGMNYLTMNNAYPLPKGGSYQLSLTISPGKRTYVNNAGQTVDFPDFEPVTGSFEIEVEDYLYTELDFTGIDSEGISAALTNALSGLTTESSTVYFKLCGQTSEYYTNLFSGINSAISNATSLFFIDASDLTTTYSGKDIQSCAMQNCSKIQGLILPDDMDHIGGYAFTGCTNLETVVFGKGLKDMSTSFDSCAKLSSVTFPAGSSFESFGNMSFSNCPVLKTLKLPASIKGISSNAFYDSGIEEFTLEDTSGTWYYTFDSETYWAWMGGTLEPPSRTENAAEGSSGLVTDLQTVQPQSQYSGQSPYTFPDGTSLIQKLTWLAKQTSNTSADFTKSIYLFHKSE